MTNWRPIAEAPKVGAILVRAPGHEPIEAIWYFGGWAETKPILGDPLLFEPTEFAHLSGDAEQSKESDK